MYLYNVFYTLPLTFERAATRMMDPPAYPRCSSWAYRITGPARWKADHDQVAVQEGLRPPQVSAAATQAAEAVGLPKAEVQERQGRGQDMTGPKREEVWSSFWGTDAGEEWNEKIEQNEKE